MKLKLKVPDHTTLSRRGKTIRPKISVQQPNNKPLHIIIDSTGLSIHGEGPWESGKKKRRGWRKLHISIDNEGRIRSSCVSKWYTQDGQRASHLLKKTSEPIASQETEDTTKEQSTTTCSGISQMLKSLSTHVQTHLFLTKGNGPTETSMFRRYSLMAFISGEENLDIINKAKWRIHFIGIRQY